MDVDALEKAAKHRSCVVIYADQPEQTPGFGTGTLLQHNGHLLVLTCHHVVVSFLKQALGEIAVLSPPQRVLRSDVELVHEDIDLDIAVLRVSSSAAHRLVGIRPLELADLGDRAAYRAAVPGTPARYCVIGFPSQLRDVDDGRRQIHMNPLVITTVVLQHDPDRILLDYRHVVRDGAVLPPEGISGALVFRAAMPGEPDDLPAVVVAMQSSWHPGERVLACSPVHQLRGTLEALVGASKPR